MTDEQHGFAWRVGQYLGLVSDRPSPAVGSQAWWRVVLGIGAAAAVSVALTARLGWL